MAPAASTYPQVYDSRGVRLGILDFAYSVVATEILLGSDGQSGQETLAFQFPTGHPKRALIEPERRIRCAGSEFVVRRIVDGWDQMQSMATSAAVFSRWQSTAQQQGGGGIVTTQVVCEAAWYDIAAHDPIVSWSKTATGPGPVIEALLEGTGWTFVGTDLTAPHDFAVGQPTTPLAALRQVQMTWGGELEFDSVAKTVGLWSRRGKSCQVVYAYGHNLAGDTRTIDTETLATRAWLYGAGNLGVETVNGGSPYIDNYSFFDDAGWPRETRAVVLSNSQLTDPAQLLAWGETQLALLADPQLTYELAVAQLPQDPIPSVGDTVQVWDSELDLRAAPRVVRRDLDVLEPEGTQIQLEKALPALATAQAPTVAGAPAPVLSNEGVVMGGQGQAYLTAAAGTNPNVGLDATGVWATRADGSTSFFLSAQTGILTAVAVLEPGSNVPAPVITGQLTDQQISDLAAAKLTGQITSTQITDGSISTPKLAAGSVSTAKLAAFAVTAGTIASATITSVQIAAATIVGANIAASSITADKLSVGSLSAISANLGTITAGALSAVTISGGTVNGGTINAATINGGTINGGTINTTTLQTANAQLSSDGALKCTIAPSAGSDGYGVEWYNAGGTVRYHYMMGEAGNLSIAGGVDTDSIPLSIGLDTQVGEIRLSCGDPAEVFAIGTGSGGDAHAPGYWVSGGSGSDGTLKDGVRPLAMGLSDLRRLRAVAYHWRPADSERERAGLIAQEVRDVLPQAVFHAGGRFDIDPLAICALLVEAVNDLAGRVDEIYDSQLLDCPAALLESASDG